MKSNGYLAQAHLSEALIGHYIRTVSSFDVEDASKILMNSGLFK